MGFGLSKRFCFMGIGAKGRLGTAFRVTLRGSGRRSELLCEIGLIMVDSWLKSSILIMGASTA